MVQTCLNPRCRPRHEAIDIKMYTEKRKSDYLDFYQDGDWMSIEDYFAEKASADVKKRTKTLAAKRNWIVKAT